MSFKKALLLTSLCHMALFAFSQEGADEKPAVHFKGSISATNNGFSFIPSFTLGKPAAIANLSIGGKRFSFEPEFRYALEGKPWSFIFIWRYKLLNTGKFQFTAGTHLPALAFRTVHIENDGVSRDLIVSQRFATLEAIPTWSVGKNTSLGMFYLYGRGLDSDATRNTHFVSLRANFTHIPLFGQVYLKLMPQVFYLKMDQKDGFYTAANFTLAVKDFPVSVSSMMNKSIRTDIAGKNFNWNISVVYSFNASFVRQ